jgi:hypothetical protein
MRIIARILIALLYIILTLIACKENKSSNRNLTNNHFPKAQTEIREAVKSIVKDAETANIDGLKAAHLISNKFTKFGPRNFDRQDLESTNISEAAFFRSISNFKQEVKDLKIDVFGDIGIATYYPHVSFEQNGETKQASGRQTLVFLKTKVGWKIVHEHGTPKW